MKSQTKQVATAIWFSMLLGVVIIQFVLGGGLASLAGEMEVKSTPLMLVGIIPLVVGVVGRMLVIPAARSEQGFMARLIICLALCETPFFIGLFLLPPELATEKAFAFVGSVLGILVLFPLTISYGGQSSAHNEPPNPYRP